jgi:hypothetical protein
MRNRILIALCATLILSSGSSICEAQFISNKINFYAGYGTGGFQGDKSINENNFIYPSLYANYNKLDVILLKAHYNYKKHFSFGITYSHMQASDWEYPDSIYYQGSEVAIQSLSADIQIHTKLAETGIWNRVSLFLELSPTTGISKLSLTSPLFDIKDENGQIPQPGGSRDKLFGIRFKLGSVVYFNQMLGCFLNYSYGYYTVSSKLYSDDFFTSHILEAGIAVKLMKNQRYFY